MAYREEDYLKLKDDWEKGIKTNAALMKKYKVSDSKIRRLVVRFDWVKYTDRKINPAKLSPEMKPVLAKVDTMVDAAIDERAAARKGLEIDDTKGWLAQINDAQSFLLGASIACLKKDMAKKTLDDDGSISARLYGKMKIVQDIVCASKQTLSGSVSLMDRHMITSQEIGDHLERVIAIPQTELKRITEFREDEIARAKDNQKSLHA